MHQIALNLLHGFFELVAISSAFHWSKLDTKMENEKLKLII